MRPAVPRLVLLWVAAATAASAAAPVPPDVSAEAARAGSARVIVRLAAPVASGVAASAERSAGRAAIAQAADAVLGRLGGAGRPDLRRYGGLPLLALDASPSDLAVLAADAGVLTIEPDRALRPSLAESIPHIGADLTASLGFTGAGTAVAIVDTGVDASHPFFGGRVVAEACFSSGRDCPNGKSSQLGGGAAAPCDYDASLCWHGTHVAGIAAGHTDGLQGVAPAASLIAIQVGSQAPGGGVVIQTSDAIAALDYVTDTLSGGYDVAAVNMSFGSGTTWSSQSQCDSQNGSFKLAIDAARARGIATVAASGNGGSTTGVESPACISSAIAVGATSDVSDVVWNGTDTGALLDLFAPGANIKSSQPGGIYGTHTGTSMASPHVAGAIAVLHGVDPSADVTTLLDALASSGVPTEDPDNGLVRPRIQVDDAVRARAPAACFDGLDNDADGRIDVDGNGGDPDPDCVNALDTSENARAPGSCGLGPELALALPLLAALRARKRAQAAAP